MRNLSVRPSRMLTTPSTKVKNVGEGGFESEDSVEDMSVLEAKLNKMACEVAAIPLSDYRKWGGHGQFDRKRYEKIFRKYTGDASRTRIYLRADIEDQKPIKKHAIVPDSIVKALDSKGYAVEDYLTGIAVSKKDGKRKAKIGKLLNKEPDLKKLFDSDNQRHGSKTSTAEFLVVISRHPYDIAGMSTGRGWTSCMNIVDGCNKHYVIRDVKYGTLVAYLVRANDKNINKPMGRVRIYAFVDEKDPARIMFVREPQIYPKDANLPKFEAIVDKWVEDTNEMLGVDSKGGTFCVKPAKSGPERELYTDDVPSKIYIVNTLEDLLALGDNLDSDFVSNMRIGNKFDVRKALDSGSVIAARAALKKTNSITPADLLKLLDIPSPTEGATYKSYNYSSMVTEILGSKVADDSVFLKVLGNPKKFTTRSLTEAGKRVVLTDKKIASLVKSTLTKYRKSTTSKDKGNYSSVLSGLFLNPRCPQVDWMTEVTTDEFEMSDTILRHRVGITDKDILEIFDLAADNTNIRNEIADTISYYWDNLSEKPLDFIQRLLREGTVVTGRRIVKKIANSSTAPSGLLSKILEFVPITEISFENLSEAEPKIDSSIILRLFERMEEYEKSRNSPVWIHDLYGNKYIGELLSLLPEDKFTPEFMGRFVRLILDLDRQDSRHAARETILGLKVPKEVFLDILVPALIKSEDSGIVEHIFKIAEKESYLLPTSVILEGISYSDEGVQRAVMNYTLVPLSEEVLLVAIGSDNDSIARRAATNPGRTLEVMKRAIRHSSPYVRRRLFIRTLDDGTSLPELPDSIVAIGLKDKDTDTRYSAAAYCTNPLLLEKVMKDKFWEVRESIAENSAATDDQIRVLLTDENERVRWAAECRARPRNIPIPKLKAKPKPKAIPKPTVKPKASIFPDDPGVSPEDLEDNF